LQDPEQHPLPDEQSRLQDEKSRSRLGSLARTLAIAGAAGTITVFALAWLLARVLVPKVKCEPTAEPRPAQ